MLRRGEAVISYDPQMRRTAQRRSMSMEIRLKASGMEMATITRM